jgi:antigen flippase
MSASATLISAPATHEPAARSDVGRRYAAAAVHTGIGGIVSRVLQGFAPIILARYLGPREYGLYALVLSLVGIVAGVSPLGQDTALEKFLPEYAIKNPARGGAILANTVILVSGVLAVLCAAFFFAANWIASALYHDASLTHVFQFSALLVLALSLFNLASSATAGLQDFRSYSRAMIARSAAFLGLGWLGVWLLGLYGAILGQLLASVLGLILLTARALTLTRQRFPRALRPQFSGEILKEVFSFAFPALLAGLLVAPAYWWANTLLARHAGFEQVGLFGVAFSVYQLILLVPSTLSISAVSFLSESHTAERHRFRNLVGTNVRLMWAITLPLAVALTFLSPIIVRIVFGASYGSAAPLASIMSYVGLVVAIGSVIGNAAAGAGRMWHAFGINGLWLVAFWVVATLLVPRWGAQGLAIAFLASYFFLAGVFWVYSRFALMANYDHARFLLALTVLSALAALVARRFLGGLPLIATGLLMVAMIMVMEWQFVIAPKERSEIRDLIQRLITYRRISVRVSEPL